MNHRTIAVRQSLMTLFCAFFISLQCVVAAETEGTVTVLNRGFPGQNSREGLARLPKVLTEKPDHLVLFFGMNDAINSNKLVGLKEYRKSLTAMVEAANRAKVKSVVLVTIHPIDPVYVAPRHPRHPKREQLQEHLAEYDAVVRDVAKETGALLADWRARFLAESPGDTVEEAVADHKECLNLCVANSGTRNGNHPTADGYRFLADEVARLLRKRIKAGETIVCFGDSLTYGSHMKGEGTATGETYPAFLSAALSQVSGNEAAAEGQYGPEPGRLAGELAPGWMVKIRLPDGKFREFKSSTAAPSVVEKEDATLLSWEGLGEGPAADLTVRLTRSLRKPGAAWRLDVENNGNAALWEVTFPDFQSEVRSDDTLVLPTISGRLHPASKPLDFKSEEHKHYPSGSLTMQCAGYYGKSGGVYIGVHDPLASAKQLAVKSENGRFNLLWRWPVPDMGVPGKSWEMPGEVLIRPFEGDWFDIALIYRSWVAAKAGWWPRGPQAGRPDIPQWFKDNPVWIMSNGPWPWKDKPPIPTDQAVAKIKKFAAYMDDIPCAVHWYNWHQVTYDNDLPHYFPADEGFAEGVREVQAAGVRVMPYINAHVWDTDLPDFETLARPAAVKGLGGTLPTKSYSGNRFACMCPATALWQQTVKDIVMKLAGPGFGVDGVYLDQVSAQAAMLCFDKSHGHPLGGGSWWTTQGYWPMLDEIRKSSPGTILTSESSAEPYVNRLDGYLTWLSYREADSAIPLFHAVYAGQVQLFGRLYKWDSWKGVAMRTKTAQALVWGEQLGWIVPDVVDDPVAGPFLKRLARMRYELRAYLARGRMARPPRLGTDGTTLTSNWVFTHDLMVTTPTVLSGAWEREDGKAVAFILVNADDQPHDVTLPFDAATYGLDGPLKARTWVSTEAPSERPVAKPVTASWSRKLTVPPLAAMAIEVEENR